MAIEINTRTYEWTYGHKPRGRGSWAFEIAGETVWIPGSKIYTEAKREALKIARERGAREIKVCT